MKMKKMQTNKIGLTIGIAAVALLVFTASAAAQTSINVESATVDSGDTFTINVTLSNTPAAGIGAYGFNISFDPTVVQVTDANVLVGFGIPNWDNDAGWVILSGAVYPGAGDGIYGNITFEAIGADGTSTNLVLTVDDLTDGDTNPVPSTVTQGLVTIGEVTFTSITVESKTVAEGGTTTINVTLSNTPAAGIGAYGFNISFDPTVVQVTDANVLVGFGIPNWDNDAGWVILSGAVYPGAGDGIYGNITFEAIGADGTSTNLVLTVDDLTDGDTNPVPSTVTDGSITVGVPSDLIVTEIEPKCGYMFANETNNITATIKNNGTADAGAFNVSFIIGEVSKEVRISGLAAGASEEVTVTDTTERNAGESVTITVIADCDGEVTESNETNNATSIAKTVVNNGYKGKRFTGEEDITTLQTYTLNGNLVYSVGDSAYVSRDTGWTTYKANWTTSDLIPSGSTVVNARLYVYHHADRTPSENITDYFILKFNGQEQSIDADYSDAKGFGSWDYSSPTGMVAYNVTDVFNMTTTNTVVLNNSYPGGGNVSIAGMVLLVVYSNSAEPERYIVINEGYDLLYAKEAYCVHSTEATAYAPFTGTIEDISNVTSAKLITVAPYGNSATMTKLFFNGQEWLGAWPAYVGSTNLGINEINVTVSETGNEARFQSYKPAGETKGDFMAASNAILVVTRGLPKTGDMDGNGVVNFNDVILLAKHYYFGDAVSDDPDVNSDGEVTFDDVILLAKHYYFGDTIYP